MVQTIIMNTLLYFDTSSNLYKYITLPIAFISKAFGTKLKGLSTYEKEYVAILLVLEQLRSYLQLGEFHIYTD
jgi:hypothetical protein